MNVRSVALTLLLSPIGILNAQSKKHFTLSLVNFDLKNNDTGFLTLNESKGPRTIHLRWIDGMTVFSDSIEYTQKVRVVLNANHNRPGRIFRVILEPTNITVKLENESTMELSYSGSKNQEIYTGYLKERQQLF